MSRKSLYKPLLFTTTLRNPERLKYFLRVLKVHDGKKLTNELAEEIAGEIIKSGLYEPRCLSKNVKKKIQSRKSLSNRDIIKILKDNPQNHKEVGFNKGWPSRFDTWFKIAKELGFVFYRPDELIKFSEIGLKLADTKHPEFERQAFLNAFSRYQRNNPFRRILNENSPLVLLLQVITKLKSEGSVSNAGISKLEIPLVIYWKDSNADMLCQRIRDLRREFGFSPSPETIVGICLNEIMAGEDIVRTPKSIIFDYPDDFIRKMRLTGLISLRGGGRFIDINYNEKAKVDHVINQYSHYDKYDTEESYFEYASTMDRDLITYRPETITTSKKIESLQKWVDHYSWDEIKKIRNAYFEEKEIEQ